MAATTPTTLGRMLGRGASGAVCRYGVGVVGVVVVVVTVVVGADACNVASTVATCADVGRADGAFCSIDVINASSAAGTSLGVARNVEGAAGTGPSTWRTSDFHALS